MFIAICLVVWSVFAPSAEAAPPDLTAASAPGLAVLVTSLTVQGAEPKSGPDTPAAAKFCQHPVQAHQHGRPHDVALLFGQGACETLGLLNTPEALPVLVKQLVHPDRWVRYKAAAAIKNMGATAKPALEDILKALAATAEPSWPIRWEDPVQIAHGELARAVFNGPLKDGINEVDTKLRYPAVRAVSTNPDGMARATLGDFFQHQLNQEDVIALAPVILAAVENPSPADTMFNNVIRNHSA